MSDPDDVERVLADRPDLAEPLESVLAVDEVHETWTFDDLSIESGPFGELVARGVVESVDDEYRLVDSDAVRTALSGEDATEVADRTSAALLLPSVGLPRVDRTTALLVATTLAFVGLVRAHPITSIYRDDVVVLSGNDPYAYRYYVERVVEGASAGEELPGSVLQGEPLYVATMAWLSELLGGTDAVGHVLAWYPVIAAVIGAAIVYLLAVQVTGDRRVGVAAVLFLALIPGHAIRTSIGYADHHAFDYLWLAMTALAVTALAGVDRQTIRDRRTWGLVLAMGIAIAGQVLSWDAGPLLVAPIGLIVAGRAALDVRRGDSPLPAGVPPVAGLTLGALFAFTVHALTGFQTTVVALAPAVVAAGSAGAVGIALVAFRLEWDVRRLGVAYAVTAAAGLVVVMTVLSPLWELFVDRFDLLFRSDAIAETQGLFSADSFGFLFLFGFALLLALPAMVVGLRRSIDDGRWLALTTYAWYFFALALVQVRFVGELATFAAVFAGIGFVWAAAWIDAIPPTTMDVGNLSPLRVPNRRVLATLFALMVLFGGFGALQVGVKTSQVVIEDDIYLSAAFIDDHATERGLEYPENYVFSDWGRNRVYNYFVNGESAGYGFALNNYREFAGGTDPDSWYDRFDGRVGYVVLATAQDGASPSSTIWRLTRNFGSADGDVPGVGHYRTVYVPPDRTRTVVAVVPGANLTGSADPETTVTVSTDVDTRTVEFAYLRRVQVDADGNWAVRVAHPGTYEVATGNDTTNVEVSEQAVERGETVTAG